MTNAFIRGFRRLAGLAGIVALAGLLSACVLSSANQLVTDDEAATPLPASFTMYGYKDADGAYAAPDAAPATFALNGKAYVGGSGEDGEMTVRFVPLGTDNYIIAITSKNPGTLYGLARYRDNIMALQMIFGDGLEDAVKAAKADAPQEIADDLIFEDGGITISKAATLQYAAGLIRDGKLPADPLIAWIAADSTQPPPPKIVHDGDWYKPE